MTRFWRCALTIAAFATTDRGAIAAAQAVQSPPSPTAQARAIDPKASALAHAIVDTAFPTERRQEMMDKLMRSMGEQMKSAMPASLMSDPGLAKIMSDFLADLPATLRPATSAFIPKQMDAVAQAYARMFTVAELTDIVAFARTPSGKHYLQGSLDVMSDPAVAAVNSEYFAQAQGLAQTSSAILGEKVAAYLKAHPEVAKSMRPATNGSDGD
jgi:hypothetical protein